MERKYKQLSTLIELSALVNSTLDTREIRERAIEAAATLADAETGSLLLVDRETGDLFFEVALGEKGGSSYRKGLSVSTAVGELRNCSGTQFDGAVVETFVRYLPEAGGYREA